MRENIEQSQQATLAEKTLEALPNEQRKNIKALGKTLEESLAVYLNGPKADPETIDSVRYMLIQLANGLHHATHGGGRKRELSMKAAILGAGMILDPARDEIYDVDIDKEVAERFVEMVENRFRTLRKE